MSFLPREIDLTENRQFSGGNALITEFRLPSNDFFERYDGEHLSSNEFDALINFEKIFGKHRHPNLKLRAFYRSEDDAFIERVRYKCCRCGKEIRDPWNKVYSLCRECHNSMGYERQEEKIPWKRFGQINFGNRTMDVFNLR